MADRFSASTPLPDDRCRVPAGLTRTGRTSAPTVLVSGQSGSGRTTLTAVWALRLATHGVRTLVAADPNSSYAGLAAACGVEPLRLGAGYPARVNILDAPADLQGPQSAAASRAGGSTCCARSSPPSPAGSATPRRGSRSPRRCAT